MLGNGELKVRWHYADDGGGLAINSHGLPNDVGIAVKIAFPDFVTEYGRLFRAWFIVLGRKIATHDGRDPDDPQAQHCLREYFAE